MARRSPPPAFGREQRRPEIVEDFDREIYGRTPKVTPKVRWEVAGVTNRTVTNAGASYPIIEKRLIGRVDNSSYTSIAVNIQLLLTLPANAAGPSPVIMVLSAGRGGYSGPPGRRDSVPAWQATILSNGWGFANLGTYSIQADGGAGLTTGIIGLCNLGQPRKLDDWGVLKAWAWGASRALDYFETDPAVNAREIGLKAIPAGARPPLWRWPTIPALPLLTSVRQGRAAQKSIAVIMARWSRMPRGLKPIIGMRATSSNMPAC